MILTPIAGLLVDPLRLLDLDIKNILSIFVGCKKMAHERKQSQRHSHHSLG